MLPMWADTLAVAERAFALSLLVWGMVSILTGSVLMAWLAAGRRASALLEHFAIQTAIWGALSAGIALVLLKTATNRDLAGATRLDRMLWLNIGLDAGYVFAGAILIITGWKFGKRLGAVGAGMAIVVQGLALAILDLILATQISR